MARRADLSRLGVLALAVGAGTTTAVLGQWLGGDERWWLALPLALALGWWFVGTPQNCLPREGVPPDAGPRAAQVRETMQ